MTEIDLRPMGPADLELVLSWRCNPLVYDHFEEQQSPLEWAGHLSWFGSRESDRRDMIIEYQGRRVGVVAHDDDGAVSIYLGETSLWGDGIATAALSRFVGLVERPLTARIHEDNARSIRLFETVGFVREGRDGEFLTYTVKQSEEGC